MLILDIFCPSYCGFDFKLMHKQTILIFLNKKTNKQKKNTGTFFAEKKDITEKCLKANAHAIF